MLSSTREKNYKTPFTYTYTIAFLLFIFNVVQIILLINNN